MINKETICAIATGMGNSGIGIIRVSGSGAITIVNKIFSGKKKISEMDSYTAAYGFIKDGDEVVDEVICLVMKGPHTYTTEDVVEINCHGGVIILKKVMELIIRNGARAAEPGEFTKRAFLGGRIDMSQAEAIMDTINAKTDMALKASINQLRGDLKNEITRLREVIIYNVAYIESALDDPENYSLDGFSEQLSTIVDNLIKSVDKLLITCDNGRILKEGIRTAIIGKPNAGKSSVLNMMLGENRAIVTNIEGTTRDTLEEEVNINGIILNLIDTAGIRNTVDIVEKIGVDKAKENMNQADLVLYIVDGTKELSDNDYDIIKDLSGKKVITLINKNDLDVIVDREKLKELLLESVGEENLRIVDISAKEGSGQDELHSILSEMFFGGAISYNDEIYITNLRHKEALINTKTSLFNVKESIDMGVGEDFYAIDLMAAYESLGLIIGETLEDDLVDKIFREFCMGK